jgi:TRAP-type mannitol/chloroaromatic compound transport system substrate-binding protein
MKIKTLVKTLLLTSLLVSPFLQAQEKVNWRLAETWGPNFPIFGDATKNMAKMVDEMSGGRFKIRIDSSNKHKSALGIFDFVKTGQYQMGHSASYYWKGKDIETLFFTTLPFGMTTAEQYAWFYHGGGMELMKETYDKYGIMSFPGGNTGNQMGGWFRKEINSLEDLKGLKMRIPGFAGEVLAKLGAKPTNIPSAELYTALERNTIDALGWHEPATELQFMVNQKAFDKLPEDLQHILTVAMKTAAYDMYTQSTHESAVNLATLQAEYPNVKIRSFSKEIMNAIKAENDKLLVEFAAADPQSKKILDSIASYQEKAREWTNFSDRAYLDNFDAK